MKRLLLSICAIFCLIIQTDAQAKIDYKAIGAPIPPMMLEKGDGNFITNAQLKNGKPVIFMIFSPQCDHCEHTIDSLKTMAGQFRNTQLILVAEGRNQQYMKDFTKKTGIDSLSLFKQIGTDKGNFIMSIYTYQLLPQFNIYDAKHKLVKSFAGVFPLDSLKQFIK